jgi:hypothetical protein
MEFDINVKMWLLQKGQERRYSVIQIMIHREVQKVIRKWNRFRIYRPIAT